MFRRIIIALSVLLFPLVIVTTASAAAASVISPPGAATATAATAAAATQSVLRLGSHGDAVRTLQQRLAALHYFDVATADGVFGP